MQVVFGITFVVVVSTTFILYNENVETLVERSVLSHVGNTVAIPALLTASIIDETLKTRAQVFALIVASIILLTVIFTYVVTRITLKPMRGVLTTQKQFIGNVAHELRTPLSVIKTNIEVTLLDPEITEDVRNTLLGNVDELDRISGIINNLLSLSNLIRPEQMEFGAVDLSAVAHVAVSKYVELSRRRRIHVAVHAGDGALLWGNLTAIRQITENLLKNAIMYTPHGGRVSVSIEKYSDQYVKLTVRDTGIGIAPKDLRRIFEPFYRSDPSRARRGGGSGSGLGLTIVSELVKLHGGKIDVQSSVSQGTMVTVLLPAVQKISSLRSATEKTGNKVVVDFSRHSI